MTELPQEPQSLGTTPASHRGASRAPHASRLLGNRLLESWSHYSTDIWCVAMREVVSHGMFVGSSSMWTEMQDSFVVLRWERGAREVWSDSRQGSVESEREKRARLGERSEVRPSGV